MIVYMRRTAVLDFPKDSIVRLVVPIKKEVEDWLNENAPGWRLLKYYESRCEEDFLATSFSIPNDAQAVMFQLRWS